MNLCVAFLPISGACGSCWVFSAIEQLESDAIRAGIWRKNQTLSAQQVVSCDTQSNGAPSYYGSYPQGCNGGWQEAAYDYIKWTGGVVTDSSYPYTSGQSGLTGTCQAGSLRNKRLTISSYTEVSGESAMINYVLGTGPLSVSIAASVWSTYTGGVLSSCDSNLNHAVQAVGVDTANGYWIVRNQWGTGWGENGYIRLALVSTQYYSQFMYILDQSDKSSNHQSIYTESLQIS
jgi:C1A family cysteine protease